MEKKDRLIKRVSVARMDSVKARKQKLHHDQDIDLLERCNVLWENLRTFRERRARAVRFTYDDQWGDLIEVNGKVMTQRQYLMNQGNAVLQTNQIKNKVDTIVGVVVKEQNEPIANARDKKEQKYGRLVTEALQANCNKNHIEASYILFLKDLNLGGLAVARESWDDTSGPSRTLDSWTRYCNPNHVFFDSEMSDPLFRDLTIIGQFYDMAPQDVYGMFAHNETDYAIIKDIYPEQSEVFRREASEDPTERNSDENLVFTRAYDPTRCRVYEVWTKETKPRIRLNDLNDGTEEIIDADDKARRKAVRQINLSRRQSGLAAGWAEEDIPYIIGDGFGRDELEKSGFFIDSFWYCRFVAPDGTILWEGESPYPDRCHPYTICATPFVDGKMVGYMWDAIDHNIAINRALVLHDWLLRAQAKGVTVVPKAIVPKDVRYEDFAHSWTAIDEMVFIDMKEGQEGLMPQVFHGAAQTFNVSELINTYSRLMENSTAVTGAIQGKTPYSGTSGALYAQMSANASTPIAALLSQFHIFLEQLHIRKLMNVAKFYTPERFMEIAGEIDGLLDDPDMHFNEVGNIEYDLSVKESPSAPVHRMVANDTLDKLLDLGAVTPVQYLKYGYHPGLEGLEQEMEALQAQAQEMAQQSASPSLPSAPAAPRPGEQGYRPIENA